MSHFFQSLRRNPLFLHFKVKKSIHFLNIPKNVSRIWFNTLPGLPNLQRKELGTVFEMHISLYLAYNYTYYNRHLITTPFIC